MKTELKLWTRVFTATNIAIPEPKSASVTSVWKIFTPNATIAKKVMIAVFGQVFRLKIISYDKDFNLVLYHTRYRHQQMS